MAARAAVVRLRAAARTPIRTAAVSRAGPSATAHNGILTPTNETMREEGRPAAVAPGRRGDWPRRPQAGPASRPARTFKRTESARPGPPCRAQRLRDRTPGALRARGLT